VIEGATGPCHQIKFSLVSFFGAVDGVRKMKIKISWEI
jgi:hypothetical protein